MQTNENRRFCVISLVRKHQPVWDPLKGLSNPILDETVVSCREGSDVSSRKNVQFQLQLNFINTTMLPRLKIRGTSSFQKKKQSKDLTLICAATLPQE